MTQQRQLFENRQKKGAVANLFGASAEGQITRLYEGRGAEMLHARWRGRVGEIDLILRENGVVVFVEVKAARSIDMAMGRLGSAQMRRIQATVEEFLSTLDSGSLTEVRFDLACVDQCGQPQILENAFGHF